ncbi:MAG TPA: hypothetical protein VJX95_06060, partial [Oscillospiraceae bacterium]|nr:hypothetical protein [Oscillospiraceae bacterium]
RMDATALKINLTKGNLVDLIDKLITQVIDDKNAGDPVISALLAEVSDADLDEIKQEIADTKKEFEASNDQDDVLGSMTVYVDSNGLIVGRDIIIKDDTESVSVSYRIPPKGVNGAASILASVGDQQFELTMEIAKSPYKFLATLNGAELAMLQVSFKEVEPTPVQKVSPTDAYSMTDEMELAEYISRVDMDALNKVIERFGFGAGDGIIDDDDDDDFDDDFDDDDDIDIETPDYMQDFYDEVEIFDEPYDFLDENFDWDAYLDDYDKFAEEYWAARGLYTDEYNTAYDEFDEQFDFSDDDFDWDAYWILEDEFIGAWIEAYEKGEVGGNSDVNTSDMSQFAYDYYAAVKAFDENFDLTYDGTAEDINAAYVQAYSEFDVAWLEANPDGEEYWYLTHSDEYLEALEIFDAQFDFGDPNFDYDAYMDDLVRFDIDWVS